MVLTVFSLSFVQALYTTYSYLKSELIIEPTSKQISILCFKHYTMKFFCH